MACRYQGGGQGRPGHSRRHRATRRASLGIVCCGKAWPDSPQLPACGHAAADAAAHPRRQSNADQMACAALSLWLLFSSIKRWSIIVIICHHWAQPTGNQGEGGVAAPDVGSPSAGQEVLHHHAHLLPDLGVHQRLPAHPLVRPLVYNQARVNMRCAVSTLAASERGGSCGGARAEAAAISANPHREPWIGYINASRMVAKMSNTSRSALVTVEYGPVQGS